MLYIPALLFFIGYVVFNGSTFERVLVAVTVFFISAAQQHLLFECSFFRAVQEMWRESVIRVALAVLTLVTGLAVLYSGFGIVALVTSRLLVTILCFGLTFIWIRKGFRIANAKFDWRYVRVVAGMSGTLVVFYAFVSVYTSFNVLFLNGIKGDSATGYYAAAFKFYSLLLIIPYGIGAATLPALSSSWKLDDKGFLDQFRRSLRYLFGLALPLIVGVFFFSKNMIFGLFGEKYFDSVIILKVLALGVVPAFVSNLLFRYAYFHEAGQGRAQWIYSRGGYVVVLLCGFHSTVGCGWRRRRSVSAFVGDAAISGCSCLAVV